MAEKKETVIDFIFLGSKITAHSDFSHEIKRHLLLGRKVMTNRGSVIKFSRDMTLLTKVHLINVMVFLVVMCRCEGLKAEHQRTDAFQLWCWRRLLRVPWTARRSSQSVLKEVNAEHSLEGLMLKLQYFGQLMWRVNELQRTLMLGRWRARGEGGDRGWDGWMASSPQYEFEQTPRDSEGLCRVAKSQT